MREELRSGWPIAFQSVTAVYGKQINPRLLAYIQMKNSTLLILKRGSVEHLHVWIDRYYYYLFIHLFY